MNNVYAYDVYANDIERIKKEDKRTLKRNVLQYEEYLKAMHLIQENMEGIIKKPKDRRLASYIEKLLKDNGIYVDTSYKIEEDIFTKENKRLLGFSIDKNIRKDINYSDCVYLYNEIDILEDDIKEGIKKNIKEVENNINDQKNKLDNLDDYYRDFEKLFNDIEKFKNKYEYDKIIIDVKYY